jgi:predicted nucleic acid-binding protein
MILLDTNLLARMTNSQHPQCAASRRAVHVLFAGREELIIVPQNLYEFWSVATRKLGAPPYGQNGLGMTTNQTSLWLVYFRRRFKLLHDAVDLVDHWHALVKTHGIKGLKSHDARLVAAMQTHGISRILTFNANDFRGFPITVIDPATV